MSIQHERLPSLVDWIWLCPGLNRCRRLRLLETWKGLSMLLGLLLLLWLLRLSLLLRLVLRLVLWWRRRNLMLGLRRTPDGVCLRLGRSLRHVLHGLRGELSRRLRG